MLGDGNEAFDAYRRINPAYTECKSDIHRTEPYIYSQMIAGRETPRSGEAKNSWLTGTASWAYVNISQYILGIRAHYDGLEFRPCMPDFIDEFTGERMFRGTRYVVHARRTGRKTPLIRVNGSLIKGNIVPSIGEKEISVEMEF
jgi:cellobiose phosphorylase